MQQDVQSLREASKELALSPQARGVVEAMLSAFEAQSRDLDQQRIQAEQQRAEAEQAEQRCKQAEARHQDAETRYAFALDTIRVLRRMLFGRKSEKLSEAALGQLSLDLGGDGQGTPVQVPLPSSHGVEEAERDAQLHKKKRKHPGRTKLAAHLERVIEDVPVPEEERTCQCCGKPMHRIGHLEHERLEYVPAKLVVHIERREKLGCSCRGDAVTAPRKVERDKHLRAGASLLAQLVEAKCDDALPIYRQGDQLKRLGFEVPDKTLYGYWSYATALLEPVAEMVMAQVLADPIVGVDDTRIRVLDRKAKGGAYNGHLWCFVGHATPMVAYDFTKSWEAEAIAPRLWSIGGHIQCDDYKGYSATIRGPDEDDGTRILVDPDHRLGCMMHVRRRFHNAHTLGDSRASEPIRLIQTLYEVEKQAKDASLDAPARLALRNEAALPVLEALEDWVDRACANTTILPKSPLGKAARYAKGQRDFIRNCYQDGRFEIDNGLCERMIREPAIGRRNYLFTGSEKAAKRLAASYTLVQSCRRLGFPARDYLIDTIHKLEAGWPLRHINDLLPDRWANARRLV